MFGRPVFAFCVVCLSHVRCCVWFVGWLGLVLVVLVVVYLLWVVVQVWPAGIGWVLRLVSPYVVVARSQVPVQGGPALWFVTEIGGCTFPGVRCIVCPLNRCKGSCGIVRIGQGMIASGNSGSMVFLCLGWVG